MIKCILSLGLFLLAACDMPKQQEINLVCKAMSRDDGGPTNPLAKELGVAIRGNNLIFSGDVSINNLPASQQKATFCPKSKYSNEKTVQFDNENCVNQDVDIGNRKQPDTSILGQYDYVTKVIAILNVGNFRCELAK